MHDQSDTQLLRAYAEHGTEAAFAEIVSRHTDLVYSAALRQVYSPDLASDVTQGIFTDLARKARNINANLSNETSLVGWLYRGTRFAARDLYRNESRRIQRERQAMAQLHPEPETPPDWEQLRPVLDDAMSELEDTDRDAVLLRYFKNHDLRTIGATLGISDDAAQKRVSRAVERLRGFFAKRGVTVGASGLAFVLSANAVQAAPAGLALSISTAAALTGTTIVTATITTASKAIAMTTLQKALVTATIAVLAGAGIYEARQASQFRGQVQTLQQQQMPLTEEIQTLQHDRDEAGRQLGVLRQENERLGRGRAELPRLRGELARLRAVEKQLGQLTKSSETATDPFTKSVLAMTARAAQLNRHLEQKPELRIPELSLLTEADWIEAGKHVKLGSEDEIRESLMMLRSKAKHNSYQPWQDALKAYLKANNGQLPGDTLQLKPYFESGIDDEILKRYRMLRTGNISDNPDGTWLIEEVVRVDDKYDSRMRMGFESLDITPVHTEQQR